MRSLVSRRLARSLTNTRSSILAPTCGSVSEDHCWVVSNTDKIQDDKLIRNNEPLTQSCLESQVVQLLLQLRDRVGPRLAVLHHLGEEEGERRQRDLLLAPRQRLVQDGRLGADHGRGRRRRHRHGGGGGGRGGGGGGEGRFIPDCPWRCRPRSWCSGRRFSGRFTFLLLSKILLVYLIQLFHSVLDGNL